MRLSIFFKDFILEYEAELFYTIEIGLQYNSIYGSKYANVNYITNQFYKLQIMIICFDFFFQTTAKLKKSFFFYNKQDGVEKYDGLVI